MTAATETKETLDRDLLLQIYESAARIRAFDDKAKSLIEKQGQLMLENK